MIRIAVALAALTLTSAAHAQSPGFGVEEIRLGVAAHDLTDHTEDGPQLGALGRVCVQPSTAWDSASESLLKAEVHARCVQAQQLR